MKTLKELEKELDMWSNCDSNFYEWYKKAIEYILQDIQNSEAISVETIEKYLNNLLTK